VWHLQLGGAAIIASKRELAMFIAQVSAAPHRYSFRRLLAAWQNALRRW
jgi:hypothetical protein